MNIGNFVVWAGCLAAFISLFLNFATASIDIGIASASESVRLIDADDEIFFIIVIVAVPVINLFKLNIVTILGIILMFIGSVVAFILNLRAKKAAGF
ncbi:MAG: hypothetical protein ACLVFI_11590 [Christensenellales bacterium]